MDHSRLLTSHSAHSTTASITRLSGSLFDTADLHGIYRNIRIFDCPVDILTSSPSTGLNVSKVDRAARRQCGSTAANHIPPRFHNLTSSVLRICPQSSLSHRLTRIYNLCHQTLASHHIFSPPRFSSSRNTLIWTRISF
jgi:hypothetical protein